MPNAVIHPTPQELTAFALGKLADTAAATVARHLETCPDCRQAIEKQPADSFVGKVRAARPSVSALPARPGEAPKVLSLPPKDLPPDLANYGKYRFVRELGRGGMGVVYQAEQTVMGRNVAVKVINPSVLDHPDALPRFQSEVKAAAKLDHPNIVRAYDAEQVGSMHLLVMECVEGSSLAQMVAKKGPLSVPYACHYVRQAALGLQHAFEQGMVHRDIKPQNLMVNARGQVKVLDFGLARMRRERKAGVGLTQVDAFMGTPEYVSPEQATDARGADIRADIYSLGCTLFFLLTGRPPFQEDTIVKQILARIEKEPPLLRDVRPEVPAELSAVVARMLAKDPERRFQKPLEVADALAGFVKVGPKSEAKSRSALPVGSSGQGTMLGADTRQVKKVLREVPGKAPRKQVPATLMESPFEELVDSSALPRTAKGARESRKRVAAAWWKRPGAMAAAVGVSVALILMAGIIIKVKVQPNNGDSGKRMSSTSSRDKPKRPPAEAIVVLEIDQPNAEVTVDGKKINVQVPGDNKPIEIQVERGRPHKLRVRKDGFEVVSRDIELQSGKSAPIRVRLEPVKVAVKPEEQPATPRPAPPVSPEKQVEAVVQKLRDLNPGFDGAVKPTIDENGVVTRLEFLTDHVTDISPLRALRGLKRLSCRGSGQGKGKLADLTPLKSMPLTSLNCDWNRPLSDLSPLKGMSLTFLACGGGSQVSDLSPLKGMPLKTLWCSTTPVSDLSPLKGMPLEGLSCFATAISDLSPLKGMPLKTLACGPRPDQDMEILRSIKTLETINGKPAAQFWKEVDGTNTSNRLPTKEKGPAAEDGFVPLFNGKDLTGWKTHPRQRGNWHVEKGVLIGSGPATSHLYSSRRDYTDFHLRVEARINTGGNSGVHFRTGFGPAFPANNPRFPFGYEAQIYYSKPGDGAQTGSLFAGDGSPVVSIREAPGASGEWFTQEVIAEGNHIVIKVDDRMTADYMDAKRRFIRGHFALEMHDPKTIVEFRKIEIKELTTK